MADSSEQEVSYTTLSEQDKEVLNLKKELALKAKRLLENEDFKELIVDQFIDGGVRELTRSSVSVRYSDPAEHSGHLDELAARVILEGWLADVIRQGRQATTLLTQAGTGE